MDPVALSDYVSQYVAARVLPLTDAEWGICLCQPRRACETRFQSFLDALGDAGFAPGTIRTELDVRSHLHLRGVFDAAGLPPTPGNWSGVPAASGVRAAQATLLLLMWAAGMELVSYGSENGGELFVNLVPLQGAGRQQEASRKGQRGHTDAASFPFRGTRDPSNPRIAPSPDMILLAGLRNPQRVETMVMPLDEALGRLTSREVELLKQPSMVLNTQTSFRQGTKRILGAEHRLDGAPVLMDRPTGVWVRYSHHGSYPGDDRNSELVAAKSSFEAACAEVRMPIVVEAGDVLIVNNRRALHGRSPVGSAMGGDARWLMRSYGLDCGDLAPGQRYEDGGHTLFP